MPRFSKRILSQYLRTDCDRQLALGLYTDSERVKMGWPREDKTRGQVQQLQQAGNRWQQTVLRNLSSTFSSNQIIGTQDPSSPTGYKESPMGRLLQQAAPNCFLVEGKYEVDSPAQAFRQALKIKNIRDFQSHPLKFSAVVPDLVQVFNPTDERFNSEVLPSGQVQNLAPNDSRLQLRIIDIKLTSEPGASYFAEVAYYAMTLAGWLRNNQLSNDFVVVPESAVWPGSHQASHIRRQVDEWKQAGYSPSDADLMHAMEEDIEVVPFDVFAPRIRRLLQEKIPNVLGQPNWQQHDWHVGSYCIGCDFLGYPWGQNLPDPPSPRTDLCWETAKQSRDLSRIPYISRGTASALRDGNITDVQVLANQNSSSQQYRQVIEKHHALRAQKKIVPSRAQSLLSSQSFVPRGTGTSASLPKNSNLKIYISTEFDLSSAISFSFGLKAIWFPPQLKSGIFGPQPFKRWKSEVHFVSDRSIQRERDTLLDFLRSLQRIMDHVSQVDAYQRQHDWQKYPSSMQIYLWDIAQRDHFLRVIGRHLDAILADPQIRNLAWLFPPEELVPNPKTVTTQSYITVVAEAVRSHVAAPVPHTYSLSRLVQHYHRPKDASYVPQFYDFFQDPLSDLIPSERGHEIWSKKPSSQTFPGWITRLQQFEKTVRHKLRALEQVTDRLRHDLSSRLSYDAAPSINIGSPANNGRPVPAASWDAQLWYTFAKLNAALDELEAVHIRAMPPHEREAKFKSARMTKRITGNQRKQVLNRLNNRLGLQLQPTPNRHIYRLRQSSRDVSIRPGDFTFCLSPEADASFLDQKYFSVIEGTPLEQQYGGNRWLRYRALLKDVMGVTVEAIDRNQGYIVIRKDRWPNLINQLETHTSVDFSQDVILDPVAPDFFTDKLKAALRAIGNPGVASDNPLVRRSVGLQGARNSPQTPHTPAADFLWNPKAMHRQCTPFPWKQAARTLEQSGYTLNRSQWRALAEGLSRRLSIIWGPPGTGKSRTLRHLVMAAVIGAHSVGNDVRILITAGTYNAIDNVILGVYDELSNLAAAASYQIYRVRSTSRSPEDAIIQRGIDVELDKRNPSQTVQDLYDRLKNEAGTTIVGVTPDQVHNLLKSQGQTKDELFDIIVVDEASQMDVAHATLPLCALAPEGKVVLAGDDLQLAPIHKAEPPRNLEDLVGSIYSFYADFHDIRSFALNTNYRSNQTIVDFGKHAGYNPSLKPYSPNLRLNYTQPLPSSASNPKIWPAHLPWSTNWTRMLDPDKPIVCFVHDDVQSSQSNPFEASAVTALLALLRSRLSKTDSQHGLAHDLDENGNTKPTSPQQYADDGFWTKGVGIVTPHKAQVGRILSNLSKTFNTTDPALLRGAVDTVERFQGQQRDVIIGSFALGDPDAIRDEDEFLYSLNRFNVMASRARAKLILFVSQTVVDHLSNEPDTLRSSGLLKTYVDQYCNHEIKMQLPYLEVPGNPSTVKSRDGRFKFHQ